MENSIYLARQPIFDENNRVFAYELLYRATTDNSAEVVDNLHATARVLINTLNYIGLNTLTHGHTAFVKVDESILMDDIIVAISPAYFVLEILESTRITPVLLAQIASLHERGYRFALNRYESRSDFMERYEPLLRYIDYVKVDIRPHEDPSEIFSAFSGYNIKFIVEKIEDEAMFNRAKSNGFSYFQGYYFCVPDLLKKENFDPGSSLLLDLIYMLKTSAPLEDLHAKFDTSPFLTINLLKFIQQSEGLSHDAVSSIEQALVLIGRRRLSSWLELMFYADSKGQGEENINAKQITQRALQRACLMEELAYTVKRSPNFADSAYITGILSMNEAMFEENYAELLNEISINKHISEALLYKRGELGMILDLAIATEKNDVTKVFNLILQLDITERDLNRCLLNSYQKSALMLQSPVEQPLI